MRERNALSLETFSLGIYECGPRFGLFSRLRLENQVQTLYRIGMSHTENTRLFDFKGPFRPISVISEHFTRDPIASKVISEPSRKFSKVLSGLRVKVT